MPQAVTLRVISFPEDHPLFAGFLTAAPAEVANALSPARVTRVDIIDAAAMEARVTVPDYQLSLAIGKEGQNARLAAKLTGARIDIQPDSVMED